MNREEVFSSVAKLWRSMGGDEDVLAGLSLHNFRNYLPSVYDVSSFAGTVVAGACLAFAELKRARLGSKSRIAVELDLAEACAAFRSEALLEPVGWVLPDVWDPIAGNYRGKDRWIRLHTNYESHKAAALKVLGVPADRKRVEEAVRTWEAARLELAIVEQGGCAATLYTEQEWARHPAGSETVTEPIIRFESIERVPVRPVGLQGSESPLKGIRVLDLTRVIAGPECTRILAAFGAEVLRIDTPGFQEVSAILPDMTVGKRCSFLDLGATADRATFDDLVAKAHILILGYRPGALEKFEISSESLRRVNPSIIIGNLNAYGWSNSLCDRRGFDSLVQMNVGIAARGSKSMGVEYPVALPVQALDHGAGFVLAAGICRSLARQIQTGETQNISTSLMGVANYLKMNFRDGDIKGEANAGLFSPALVEASTDWGPVRRVVNPGIIDGRRGLWSLQAGELGRHPARFEVREDSL